MEEDRSSQVFNDTPKMNSETGQKKLGWIGQRRVRRRALLLLSGCVFDL